MRKTRYRFIWRTAHYQYCGSRCSETSFEIVNLKKAESGKHLVATFWFTFLYFRQLVAAPCPLLTPHPPIGHGLEVTPASLWNCVIKQAALSHGLHKGFFVVVCIFFFFLPRTIVTMGSSFMAPPPPRCVSFLSYKLPQSRCMKRTGVFTFQTAGDWNQVWVGCILWRIQGMLSLSSLEGSCWWLCISWHTDNHFMLSSWHCILSVSCEDTYLSALLLKTVLSDTAYLLLSNMSTLWG